MFFNDNRRNLYYQNYPYISPFGGYPAPQQAPYRDSVLAAQAKLQAYRLAALSQSQQIHPPLEPEIQAEIKASATDGGGGVSFLSGVTTAADAAAAAAAAGPFPDFTPNGYVSRPGSTPLSYSLWGSSASTTSSEESYRRHFSQSLCRVVFGCAIILVIMAVLGIVGIAVYLGVITSEEDGSEFEVSYAGALSVTKGDTWIPDLAFPQSPAFKAKASKYERMLETVYDKSIFDGSLKRAKITQFRKMPSLNSGFNFNFKLALDRRKMPDHIDRQDAAVEDVLLQEVMSLEPIAFHSVNVDIDSLQIKRDVPLDQILTPKEVVQSPVEEDVEVIKVSGPQIGSGATIMRRKPSDTKFDREGEGSSLQIIDNTEDNSNTNGNLVYQFGSLWRPVDPVIVAVTPNFVSTTPKPIFEYASTKSKPVYIQYTTRQPTIFASGAVPYFNLSHGTNLRFDTSGPNLAPGPSETIRIISAPATGPIIRPPPTTPRTTTTTTTTTPRTTTKTTTTTPRTTTSTTTTTTTTTPPPPTTTTTATTSRRPPTTPNFLFFSDRFGTIVDDASYRDDRPTTKRNLSREDFQAILEELLFYTTPRPKPKRRPTSLTSSTTLETTTTTKRAVTTPRRTTSRPTTPRPTTPRPTTPRPTTPRPTTPRPTTPRSTTPRPMDRLITWYTRADNGVTSPKEIRYTRPSNRENDFRYTRPAEIRYTMSDIIDLIEKTKATYSSSLNENKGTTISMNTPTLPQSTSYSGVREPFFPPRPPNFRFPLDRYRSRTSTETTTEATPVSSSSFSIWDLLTTRKPLIINTEVVTSTSMDVQYGSTDDQLLYYQEKDNRRPTYRLDDVIQHLGPIYRPDNIGIREPGTTEPRPVYIPKSTKPPILYNDEEYRASNEPEPLKAFTEQPHFVTVPVLTGNTIKYITLNKTRASYPKVVIVNLQTSPEPETTTPISWTSGVPEGKGFTKGFLEEILKKMATGNFEGMEASTFEGSDGTGRSNNGFYRRQGKPIDFTGSETSDPLHGEENQGPITLWSVLRELSKLYLSDPAIIQQLKDFEKTASQPKRKAKTTTSEPTTPLSTFSSTRAATTTTRRPYFQFLQSKTDQQSTTTESEPTNVMVTDNFATRDENLAVSEISSGGGITPDSSSSVPSLSHLTTLFPSSPFTTLFVTGMEGKSTPKVISVSSRSPSIVTRPSPTNSPVQTFVLKDGQSMNQLLEEVFSTLVTDEEPELAPTTPITPAPASETTALKPDASMPIPSPDFLLQSIKQIIYASQNKKNVSTSNTQVPHLLVTKPTIGHFNRELFPVMTRPLRPIATTSAPYEILNEGDNEIKTTVSDETISPATELRTEISVDVSYSVHAGTDKPDTQTDALPDWCSPGQFICGGSKCVRQDQVCDGQTDCPNGDDEKNCVTISPVMPSNELRYHDEGYLMVRQQGVWGKLCLDNFETVISKATASWTVDDLGEAVCNTLTFDGFNRVERQIDPPLSRSQTSGQDNRYFEINIIDKPALPPSRDPTGEAYRSSSNLRMSLEFKATTCPRRDVVKVACSGLQCGMRPRATNLRARIVGGNNSGPGSWPWHAALYKEGEYQCGASLINDRWLVSAGHCFYSATDDYWVARLGALRRGTKFPSPYEQLRHISHIFIHPNYVDTGFINDISMLRLEEPVHFTDWVRPVCLPPPDVQIQDGRLCTLVGWGQLFEVGRIFPDTLQEVQVPLISTGECSKRTALIPLYRITNDMFCAGYDRGGRDACLGDSGGPLMCQEPNGSWQLMGVTSNGYGCARPHRPGVYTKVTNYMKWMDQVMEFTKGDNVKPTPVFCSGHRCPLGQCLAKENVCNGFVECSDGSDELNCDK